MAQIKNNGIRSFVIVYIIITYHSMCSSDFREIIYNHFKKNKVDGLGDLQKCRVTHSGVEYKGNIASTKTGILCQNWETPNPIHKVAEQIENSDFPEGSKKKAKNYCRNPRHWSGRPWCYTLSFNVTVEQCDVPLCMKKECRMTGPGVEYSGRIHSVGSKDCFYWSELRGAEHSQIMYDSLFPDGTRKKAENRCRNPDSDAGGPWCFVETASSTAKPSFNYEKAYCGIPLCDPKICMTAIAAVSSGYQDYHTVFSKLPFEITSINFSVKLWHPDQWSNAELKLALAVLPVPATGSQMRLWKTGIEIIISTYKSGLTPKKDEEPDWNIEAGLLSGTHWQDLELSWAGGFITLKIRKQSMSIFTRDFTGNKDDLSIGQFQYYSIKGSNALWNFPYCLTDYAYEEHITTHGDFERRWLLPKSSEGLGFKFFVRGFHTAMVELKAAAMLQFPSIQLTLQNKKNGNFTTLSMKESSESERIILEKVKLESLMSYWQWREFALNIDGPRLELFWIKDSRPGKILSVINPRIGFLKWFSIGSRHSTVHWTINCSPSLKTSKMPAELPECVMNDAETDFRGTQSVSATGLTCVPWADKTGWLPQDLNDYEFVDGSKEDAKNYCRNPKSSAKGPYCYVADLLDSGFSVSKQYCFPPKCRSKECRISGTGNDYIGTLDFTMSNRTCRSWSENTSNENGSINMFFPDFNVTNARNFCRNPSQDIDGPWCYTSDPLVDIDVCNVPDCDVLGACRIVIKGDTPRQHIYILPLWRSYGLSFKIKTWDPKWTKGIRFEIKPSNESSGIYRLDFVADGNDKIILSHIDSEGIQQILKKKHVAHLISSGYWEEFVLILGDEEISIKYENVPTAFFQWKKMYSKALEPLHPRFLSYYVLGSSTIGLSFPCDECHTHINLPGPLENSYPLDWWNPTTTKINNIISLYLNIRGTGSFDLVLFKLLNSNSNNILIEFHDFGMVVIKDQYYVLAEAQQKELKMFTNSSWSNLSLLLTEEELTLKINSFQIINYRSSRPMIYYFFSLSVSNGSLTWNANCDPPNIDASPVDGGWSTWGLWHCSVSCGGGRGKRRRLCNFPKPNLFGRPCNGSDVMEGVCNDFKCGDVPPQLYKTMAARILSSANNIRVQVGESLLLMCDSYILTELRDTSPSTKLEWTRDGMPLYPPLRAGNVTADQFIVKVTNVSLSESGVYMCSLEDRKKTKGVIALTAVTVVTNVSTRFTRVNNKLLLDCQTGPLFYLFPDLAQFWTLNGKLFQDYDSISHGVMDVGLLYPVRVEHEGEWECTVFHVKHNLTWATAWFRLKVGSNTWIAVMFDKLFVGYIFKPFGSNIAANSIIGLILFLILVCFVTVAIVVIKFNKRQNNQYMQEHNKLLQ